MIEALAAIGGGGTLVGLLAVVVLAFKYAGAVREQLAARDLLDTEREELRKTRGELDVETATHAVTAKRLDEERELRIAVEAQRNDAYRRARDFYAAKLKASNVADAVRLVDELLALPVVVPEDHDVPAGDPARTDDDLLRP